MKSKQKYDSHLKFLEKQLGSLICEYLFELTKIPKNKQF